MTVFAYCWRSGEIEFAHRREDLPKGCILIATGDEDLPNKISDKARHAYDGKTLLVPGVPENMDDPDEAVDALLRWCHWSKLTVRTDA